jgi:hypothetical protein
MEPIPAEDRVIQLERQVGRAIVQCVVESVLMAGGTASRIMAAVSCLVLNFMK